jgi:hypothetical protein
MKLNEGGIMRISWVRSTVLLLAVFVIACQQSGEKNGVQKFGGEITLSDPVSLAAVYESPEKYEGQEILLTGQITQVCQTRGCWMKLSDGQRELIVRFKDYGFFVPKDAASSKVIIQGIFTTKPDMHMMEEAHAQEKGEKMMAHGGETAGHPSSHNQEPSEMQPVEADEDMPYSFIASAVEIYPAESSDI